MVNSWRRQDEEVVLELACPVCYVAPGYWCVYTGQRSVRIGTETQRLHPERRAEMWLQRPKRIRGTLPNAVAPILDEFDRRENRQLRAWLRRNVHLLLDLN